MLARIWLLILIFLAFTFAINIWFNKPGPAFSFLFLIFGFSWFSYISSTIVGIFALANPNLDITNLKNTVGGRLITLSPHYNGRLLTYWQQPPHILAEFDTSVHAFAQNFGLNQDPRRALFLLLLYGFIPFLLALYAFQNREMSQ